MNRTSIILTIAAAIVIAAAGFGETITSVVSTSKSDVVIGQTTIGNTTYSQISLSGADRLSSVPGCPRLPVRIVRFALPYNATITNFSAKTRNCESIALPRQPAPAQPPAALNGGAAPELIGPSDAVYKGRSVYPAESAVITRISALSEYKIVEICVCPVRYDPVAGNVSLSGDIALSLQYSVDHGKQLAIRRRSALAQNAITSSVRRAVSNKTSLASGVRVDDAAGAAGRAATDIPSGGGTAVDFLIITSGELEESFRPLAAWRTGTGMVTEIRTVEWIGQNYAGADLQEKIRTFIQAGWSQWGTAFVLLGGAPSVVPVRYVPWTAWPGYIPDLRVPTDLYYSDIVDTCYGQDAHQYNFNYNRNDQYGEVSNQADRVDLQPDVFLGRAPVETPAQAAAFVAKVLRYEQHPPPGFGPSFLMMADGWLASLLEMVNVEPLAPSAPWIDPLEQYTPVSGSGYSGDEALSAASAMDRLNQGYNLAYHMDHGGIYSLGTAVGSGGGWLYRTEAQSLQNAARPSIVVTPACSPNAFDHECFSKSMINNPDGGAVAFIGNTRVGFTDQASQCQSFFIALYQNRTTRLGEAFNSLIDGGWSEYHRLAMNLLGDPAMPVWTDEPRNLTVAHNAGQSGAIKRVTVSVACDAAGDSALVCLHKGGEIHAVSWIVLPGSATFTVAPYSQGHLHVTVTGRGLLPYRDSCWIDATAVPPAMIAALRCCDATGGNGDWVANPGEMIDLYPEIAVSGNVGIVDLSLSVAVSDPSVIPAGGAIKLANLAAGAVIHCDSSVGGGFSVKVSPAAASGPAWLDIDFRCVLADGEPRQWRQQLHLAVLRDSMVHQSHRAVLRDMSASADSRLGPGHTFMLVIDSITVANLGDGASGALTVRLMPADSSTVALDSSAIIAGVRPGNAAVLAQPLRLFLQRTGPGSSPASIVINDASGRGFSWPVRLSTAAAIPGVSARAVAGGIQVTWQDSAAESARGYWIYRSPLGADGYHRVNATLVTAASQYIDTTAVAGSRYIYAAVRIDSSGNASRLSIGRDTVSAPPAAKPGFPVALGIGGRGNRMWASPAVGDLDGDGHAEIIMGSDDGKVYAFSRGGVPLPGWPVALGVQIDNSTPALADLDGDGLPEVIVGTGAWYTAAGDGLVHAFKGSGTEASGWPQPVWGDAFANCAVSDLNGDGWPEVIAATTAGLVYAWGHDGVPLPGWPRQAGDRVAASPAIGDVDGDGQNEVVVTASQASGLLLNVFTADGQQLPGWPRAIPCNPGYALSAPALGDIDADGVFEIIQAAGPEAPWGTVKIHCFNADGSQPSGWPAYVAPYVQIAASPALADLDGDGRPDVVICGSDGVVRAFSSDGMNRQLWQANIGSNGRTNPVIADLDGNGVPDVVLTSEAGLLEALSGNDGSRLEGFTFWIEPSWSAPAVADVDNDGKLDLVATGWGSHRIFAWETAQSSGNAAGAVFRGNNSRTGCYLQPVISTAGGSQMKATTTRGTPTMLLQNYPNPVARRTTIRYQIATAGGASLKVYNILGQQVATLFAGDLSAGCHEVTWNRTDDRGNRVADGTYLYRLETPGRQDSRRMVVIR